MTDSHEQHALALFVGDGLPIFQGQTYEDHVAGWHALDLSGQRHLWAMAAIAASLERQVGGRPKAGAEPEPTDLQRFAYEVRCSARWVQNLAKTYRTFGPKQGNPGAAVPAMSFKHHLIAATCAETPQEALRAVERAHDEEMSTRELYVALKGRPEPQQAIGAVTRHYSDQELVDCLLEVAEAQADPDHQRRLREAAAVLSPSARGAR